MAVLLLPILFLVLVPIVILFLLPKSQKYAHKPVRPPGPPGLPLVGNFHQFDNSAPHIYLQNLSRKYGPIMSMQLGSVPTLIVSSASVAREVFKTHDRLFSSRPTLIAQQRFSYDGLDVTFSPYSEYWRDMRKVCTLHLFSTKSMQSFRPFREDEVARMIKNISDQAASSSKAINLSETMITVTISVICRIMFGIRYDEAGIRKFNWILSETQAIYGSFFVADYFPMMGWIDKLSGQSARLDKSFKEIDQLYERLIHERLSADQNQISKQGSILDLLLRMKKDQLFSFEIGFDHIKALLMTILVAGSDTSAVVVVWAMSLLMKNPAIMKKVQEEVRGIVGNKGSVDEDDVQKLTYLKLVVKETMRLYPPAPLLLPRETTDRCEINGYEIQANSLVFVNAWAIARDPESWEKPDEFIPERFLNCTVDFKGTDFELIPFGAGRRICPGMNIGVATAELALGNLLYSFDWELPAGMNKEDIDMDAKPGITMHKKNDLCLVAKIK